MTRDEQFISDVLSRIPLGRRRDQIEMDLRGHIAERVEHGQSVDEAVRQFGDPRVLADSYLASIPLVSASFASRAVAKLIDFPTVIAAACIILWIAWQSLGPVGAPFFPGFFRTENPAMFALSMFTFIFMCPGYFVLAEYMTDRTLGKRIMGLRVVRESGARISLGQSIVRQLPMVGSFFLIDVLFALFTEKNQRAFELITKTRVVRDEEEAG